MSTYLQGARGIGIRMYYGSPADTLL